MRAEFVVNCCRIGTVLNCDRTGKELSQEMSLPEQPIYRSSFSLIRAISEGKCLAVNWDLTVFLLKWNSA